MTSELAERLLTECVARDNDPNADETLTADIREAAAALMA